MNLSHRSTILRITILSILLLLPTACAGRAPSAENTLSVSASPTEDISNLSPDDILTLRSLEKVNNYPFYIMHYYGDYEFPPTSSIWNEGSDISCSLFTSLGESGDILSGRNFDWVFSPALLLYTDPPDGYASASMVDLTFLRISPDSSMTLTDLPLAKRNALLSAPSMPFDGMNEYGLAIAMAALPDEFEDDASYDRSKPNIGSIDIIRQILDHAKNVAEALAIFEQYNINFGGGPPIHYLLADRSGKAVLVEFYQGELILLPNENPWHIATNHLRYTAEGNGGCQRYRTIFDRLNTLDGKLAQRAAMQLLSEVRQDITQWSAVYDMTNGDINIAIAGSYDSSFSFHLDLLAP